MKRIRMGRLLVVAILLSICGASPALAADVQFTPHPETEYARQFTEKCDGQQWFIDEIERLLNMEQKSLDRVESAAELANIKSLGLKGKGVQGSIPRAIGELHELRYLFLADNKLSGTIPSELYTLPKLQNIDLANNAYAMPLPGGFGNMPTLTHLNLRGNAFTGNIPESMLQNTRLTFLDVSSNRLTGYLPAGLSGMTALSYLAVSDNAWGGALPDLTALTSLLSFSAWNCKLTGEIPDTLYRVTSLQVLDLAGNSLTGALKPAVGELRELQLLSVGTNELTGAIPAELGGLFKLQMLDLSDNTFSGVLPDAFSGMTALKTVHIENNQLRGMIPASLKGKLDGGTEVFAQNNYMTGAVLAGMKNSEKNFADGASTEQYQLSAPDSLQISTEQPVDLYSHLVNRSLKDDNTTRKPRLVETLYTVTIKSGADKITLTRGDGKILVQAKERIPASVGVVVELAILDNDGSSYSKTTVLLTTDVPSSGGGGGTAPEQKPTPTTVHEPYITGYPDKSFRADANISREEIAKMLICVLGEELPETTAYTSFTDVERERWSAPYIERAKRLNDLQGGPDGAFRPTDSMTRAELAVCLSRAAERTGAKPGDTKSFSDVDEGKWYAKRVASAAALGLITGYADGTFRPESNVTRAEAAAMMNRLVGRNPETASGLLSADCPFSDLSKTDWAYTQIMEAAVRHNH